MGAEEACGRATLLPAATCGKGQCDHRRPGRAARHRCGCGRAARKAAAAATTAAAVSVPAAAAPLATLQAVLLETAPESDVQLAISPDSSLDLDEQAAAEAPAEACTELGGGAAAASGDRSACSEVEGDAIGETQVEAAPAKGRKERHVHWDEEESVWYRITPYAEVYGLHPRLFDFDKSYWMVPSKGFPDPSRIVGTLGAIGSVTDEDEESSSDSELEEDLWYEVSIESFQTGEEHQGEEGSAARGGGTASGAGC
mmetsp:Transcript_126932/g.353489  ORF Transcript_126932/g.353489 Transcript_126932/m.353489 type:complete len:256 (-) Transcript_126932:144-911(-)